MFWQRKAQILTDGIIDLAPIRLEPPDRDMRFGTVYDFAIHPHGRRVEAGMLSIRLGESECVYYFGHIGYHIDPPYRGHHWAQRACQLAVPLIRHNGKHSVVITCDPDNQPSVRTCEHLGCTLERTVAVPAHIRSRWEISAEKRRYIWRLDETGGS